MKTLILTVALGAALAAADTPFKHQVFNDFQTHSHYYRRSNALTPRHLGDVYQNIGVRSPSVSKSKLPSSARGAASSHKTPIGPIGPKSRSSQTSSVGKQSGLPGSTRVVSRSPARGKKSGRPGGYKPLPGSDSSTQTALGLSRTGSGGNSNLQAKGKIGAALQTAAENPGTAVAGAAGGILTAVGAGGQSYLGATAAHASTAQHVAGALAPAAGFVGASLSGYATGVLSSEMGKIQEQNSANQGHQPGGSPPAASTSSQPTLEVTPQAGQTPVTGAGNGSPHASAGQHGTSGDVEQGTQKVPKRRNSA